MLMATILLINSDLTVQNAIESALDKSHILISADTFQMALKAAKAQRPDLIILDVGPVTSEGVGICRQLRSASFLTETPILTLVGIKNTQAVVTLLDAGGDDCVRKPFSSRELAARMRALLRRNERGQPRTLLLLNPIKRTVQFGAGPISLTPTEYDLLEALCKNPGQHVSTTKLLEQVWNYPPGKGDPALVRNHVRNLRLKLESDPERPRILTCYQGRGYAVSVEIRRQTVPQLS
jgi:DNA-binding response OmpR family regulator